MTRATPEALKAVDRLYTAQEAAAWLHESVTVSAIRRALMERAGHARAAAPLYPLMHKENEMSLSWSDPSPPGEHESFYDHVIAETPLGEIVLEWKSWKDYDPPGAEMPWAEWVGAPTLDLAKAAVQAAWDAKIAECAAFTSAALIRSGEGEGRSVEKKEETKTRGIADQLRDANISMNRYRNNVVDDGPSGAARAGHLSQLCRDSARELDRLKRALQDFDDPSRFDITVRSLAHAHLAQCADAYRRDRATCFFAASRLPTTTMR